VVILNRYNNKLASLKGCPTKVVLFISRIAIFIHLNSSQKKLVILISLEVLLYTLWELFEDKDKIILFNDYDILDNDILT
jgi:hypothetical protein